MTTNRGRDDDLVNLEPERRSKRTGDGETATRRDRRVADDAPERRLSRRACRSEGRNVEEWSGRTGEGEAAASLRLRCGAREERNGD
jgi:hypothetical protein